MIELALASEQATERLGTALAEALPDAGVIYLRGELGAGKTTLVRALLRALGHLGTVKSPTYTLVESYAVAGKQVFHFDLYRIADPEELEYIGLRDYLDGKSLLLLEWPERGAGVLPPADLDIELRFDEEVRTVGITALSALGRVVLDQLDSRSFSADATGE
jgi:tRNA threonylcarbamoyladenosine biosynthesis protein TsaE